MMKKISWIILFITFFNVPDLTAQNISNFSYRLQGDSIVVNYDLEGIERDIIITLLSSMDDYSEPLIEVSGAIGDNQKPGEDLAIIWKAKEELGEFKGSLQLKLSARYAPYLELDDDTILEKYKRGKSYPVSFETNMDSDISWSINKGREEVASGSWKANTESYSFTVPSKTKKGKDYRLVLSSEGGLRDVSEPIIIKPKYPGFVKALPVLLVGTAVVLYVTRPEDPEPIPDPFLPE